MTPVLDTDNIRKTLRDWGSLKDLAASPLIGLKAVQTRHKSAGYSDSSGGFGLALRDILEKAVQSLRPDEGAPNLLEKRWRAYIILNMQYIEGRSPEYLQEQLHISHGTYFAEQNRAFALLADKLQKSEEMLVDLAAVPIAETGPSHPVQSSAPFMAPPYPAYPFIGRNACLSALKHTLLAPRGQVVSALNGLPGAGKTRLAMELAYDSEIRARYADGILWAGLGQTPDILALLGSWAAALNVPPDVIAAHAGPDERINLLHTAIGQRRFLLIIDDAWQSAAALSFKLGGPNCAYLLTTRLPDVAADFACDHVSTIHEMDIQDGLALLNYFSPGLLSGNPEEARSLALSVGNLPLALILIGRYLQKHDFKAQPRRLAEALDTLKTIRHRLELSQPVPTLELNPGVAYGTPLSLQTVIGLSDSALEPVAHQALMALSVFLPKPDSFSEEAALAVMGTPVQVLDALVDIGLVECLPPDRYMLHQTISDYARLQNDNQAAVQRLIDYFVNFAIEHSVNFDKLDLEINNLLAVCQMAYHNHRTVSFLKLVNAIYYFLEIRGLYKICQTLLDQALDAAQNLEDSDSVAIALYNIGDLGIRTGNFPLARQYLERSISICRDIKNHELEANNLINLGIVCMYSGEWREGLVYFKQALQKNRNWHFADEESWTLSLLGFACMELCTFQEGFEYLDQALQICNQTGNRRVEGFSWFNRCTIYLPMGNYAAARHAAEVCEVHYKAIGDLRGLAWLSYTHSRIARQQGNYSTAQTLLEEAHQAFINLGDWMGLGFATHNLGRLAAELDDAVKARALYEQALSLFQKIGCHTGESQCFHSLGVLYRQQGDIPAAYTHLHKALEIRRRITYPRGIAKALANLALLHSQSGDHPAALDLALQAVQTIRPSGALPALAYTLICLGEVQLARSDLPQARAAFKEALQIQQDIGQNHLIWEPLAGLARVAVNGGLYNRAASLAAEALALMEKTPCPAGVLLPKVIYDDCININSTVYV